MNEKGTGDGVRYEEAVVGKVPCKVIDYTPSPTAVILLVFGLVIGAFGFWAGMGLLNKSFTECYTRGGVVKLPLAASGGAEGKNSPVWGYFTTLHGRQYYLVSLGLTKEGPEFDSYYREPLVIMGKKEFEKIVEKTVTAKIKTKKK